MYCSNCGVKLAGVSKFCPECGAKLAVQEEKENVTNQDYTDVTTSDIYGWNYLMDLSINELLDLEAETHGARVQFMLGLRYDDVTDFKIGSGPKTPKNSYGARCYNTDNAAEWYLKAAEQGQFSALYNLGIMEGKRKFVDKAYELLPHIEPGHHDTTVESGFFKVLKLWRYTVSDGDRVKKGDLVAMLLDDSCKGEKAYVDVISPADGIISFEALSRNFLALYPTVNGDTTLARIDTRL